MKRREFLKSSTNSLLLLGLSPLLSLTRAQADTGASWFFVQLSLKYGWDVTLGVDPYLGAKPKDSDLFLEYDPANIARVGNLAFGPAFAPMKDFASNMCVINGVFMNATDNGHDAAEKYIKSGTVDTVWGEVAVEILETRAAALLGILNNGGVSLGNRSATLTDLSVVRSLGTNTTTDADFISSANANNHLSQVQAALTLQKAQTQKLMQLLAADAPAGSSTQLTDAQLIAGAFASGLAQVVDYQLTENLDTHSAHPTNHLTAQTNDWNKVVDLMRIFKQTQLDASGTSLFDRTTFMITSEFSRTAALNASQGKDHNPLTNSAVLIGPTIRGNTTVGGSHLITADQSTTGSSYHIASPIDLQTGRALDSSTNATVLRPENVVATVIESMGISRRRFASVSPSVPSLFSLIKK